MADDIERAFDISALREALYGDSFSESTEKSGRNLLLVGTVTLITAVFDVGVKSTPLVPLDFSAQPDSLIIFLAIANLALLINYVLRVSNDFLRAREDWANARKFIEVEGVLRARRRAQGIDESISAGETPPGGYPMIEEWWESYSDTKAEAEKRIRKIEAEIGERRLPIFVRWTRLVFLGGLPLLVGVLAVGHTWEKALCFLLAVIGL